MLQEPIAVKFRKCWEVKKLTPDSMLTPPKSLVGASNFTASKSSPPQAPPRHFPAEDDVATIFTEFGVSMSEQSLESIANGEN